MSVLVTMVTVAPNTEWRNPMVLDIVNACLVMYGMTHTRANNAFLVQQNIATVLQVIIVADVNVNQVMYGILHILEKNVSLVQQNMVLVQKQNYFQMVANVALAMYLVKIRLEILNALGEIHTVETNTVIILNITPQLGVASAEMAMN